MEVFIFMKKEQKGVRLDHITKLYKDYKTGKEFLQLMVFLSISLRAIL